MKKNGIINPELIRALTDLGHFDSFVICDMGFPIPPDAVRIDLTFVPGEPVYSLSQQSYSRATIIPASFYIPFYSFSVTY